MIADYSSDKTDTFHKSYCNTLCLGILVEERKTYIFQIISMGSPLSCTLLICLISWIISLWLIIICCTLMLETSVFKKVDSCSHVLVAEEFLYCVLQTWQGGTCSMVLHSKPQNISYNLSSQHIWHNQSFIIWGWAGNKENSSKNLVILSCPCFSFIWVFIADCESPCLFFFFFLLA